MTDNTATKMDKIVSLCKRWGWSVAGLVISLAFILVLSWLLIWIKLSDLSLLPSDFRESIEQYVEGWFPGEVMMKSFMGMGVAIPLSDFEGRNAAHNFRQMLSSRANRYLTDENLEYLLKNSNDAVAWNSVFAKIPQRKAKWFLRENGVGLGKFNVYIFLIPSLTGWKIDGLKHVSVN